MKKTETVYLSHGATSNTEEQLELRERPSRICQGEPQVYVKSGSLYLETPVEPQAVVGLQVPAPAPH